MVFIATLKLQNTATGETAELFFDEVILLEPVTFTRFVKGRKKYLFEGFSEDELEWEKTGKV